MKDEYEVDGKNERTIETLNNTISLLMDGENCTLVPGGVIRLMINLCDVAQP